MHMVGQSRSGASAEIDADIEAVGLNSKRKDLLGVSCHFGHFKKLLVVCPAEIGNMPERRNEQMPIVIREAIHHCDTVFGTPQDKIAVVILRSFDIFADEALAFVGEALDVPDSPRSPKIFSFQFIYTSMRYGRPLKNYFPGTDDARSSIVILWSMVICGLTPPPRPIGKDALACIV